MVHTPNTNYYDVKKSLPTGVRMSTAEEELNIQLGYERAKKDPRKDAPEFYDNFAKNIDKKYIWSWTETGLRVPKGWDDGRIDKLTGKYPRIVLIGDEEADMLHIPVGDGRLIVSWGRYGLPSDTAKMAHPHDIYTTQFYFNVNPNIDNISNNRDVAVGRNCSWHHVGVGRYLIVNALYERWCASSNGGFRPVRGSDFEAEKIFSAKMIEDFITMTFLDFQKKYLIKEKSS